MIIMTLIIKSSLLILKNQASNVNKGSDQYLMRMYAQEQQLMAKRINEIVGLVTWFIKVPAGTPN